MTVSSAFFHNFVDASSVTFQFFSEYPAMGVHPLLLEWHGSVMTIGDARWCRAVLKEFTDGVDLAELGREFQSETVLGKKENL